MTTAPNQLSAQQRGALRRVTMIKRAARTSQHCERVRALLQQIVRPAVPA